MEKRKKLIIIGCFIFLIVFGANQYKENRQYEKYLSHKLVNDISIFSSSTVMNSNYLDDVIEKQQITEEQLHYIIANYEEVRSRGGEIVDLAENWLEKIEEEDHYLNPYPVYMATEFLSFLRALEHQEFKRSNSLMLSSNQIKKFELIKLVNTEWVKAIEDNIEGVYARSITELENGERIATQSYFDTYKEDMINSEDWVEMIIQMQKASKHLEKDVEMLY